MAGLGRLPQGPGPPRGLPLAALLDRAGGRDQGRGYDLTARNPDRPEGETLPSPVEIVAELLEKEREILSIMEELDELLSNSHNGGERHG